jgi:hypothetical protein
VGKERNEGARGGVFRRARVEVINGSFSCGKVEDRTDAEQRCKRNTEGASLNLIQKACGLLSNRKSNDTVPFNLGAVLFGRFAAKVRNTPRNLNEVEYRVVMWLRKAGQEFGSM